ncbi:MAG: Fe-S cluster assembly protein SufD, partial [Parvularcula sp.]|nr:Fe-S cluster assembly protein SufD [Parvularcula sp.]
GSTYVVEDGLIVSFYDEGRNAEAIEAGEELSALAAIRPLISISVLPGFSHKIVLRRLSDGEGRHGDNVYLTVGEGAEAALLETHEITGRPFVNSRTEIEIDAEARLDRLILQPAAEDAILVHSSAIRLDEEKDGEKATLRQTTIALGAQLARHETRVTHLGASDAKIDALYRLGGKRHVDITTHVTFEGESAVTDQLVKGVGDDRARGVFQGKFLVKRGAQQTDAKMAHHALLLSKGAQVNAKPELEIYADDVECAHGNTAGALDPEALFYMRQRGVSESEARALLIDAFTSEVIERINNAELRDLVGSMLEAHR